MKMNGCKDGPQPEQWKIHVKKEDNDRLNALREHHQALDSGRRVHASEVIRRSVKEAYERLFGDVREAGRITGGDS
jgi:hypothetical protein